MINNDKLIQVAAVAVAGAVYTFVMYMEGMMGIWALTLILGLVVLFIRELFNRLDRIERKLENSE